MLYRNELGVNWGRYVLGCGGLVVGFLCDEYRYIYEISSFFEVILFLVF